MTVVPVITEATAVRHLAAARGVHTRAVSALWEIPQYFEREAYRAQEQRVRAAERKVDAAAARLDAIRSQQPVRHMGAWA